MLVFSLFGLLSFTLSLQLAFAYSSEPGLTDYDKVFPDKKKIHTRADSKFYFLFLK